MDPQQAIKFLAAAADLGQRAGLYKLEGAKNIQLAIECLEAHHKLKVDGATEEIKKLETPKTDPKK